MAETQRAQRHAMVAAVNADLAKLGLAAEETERRGVLHRTLPPDAGWCQATYAPEEGWPPDAYLCVVVTWYPAPRFRRSASGCLPERAPEHWRRRVHAVREALAKAGYLSWAAGPPRSPALHSSEQLLVWRSLRGIDDAWPPLFAWDGLGPARPNFGQPTWVFPERNPLQAVEAAVRGMERGLGRARVVQVMPVIWPPYAEMCARVLWEPDARYARLPDGSMPLGALEHWTAGLDRVRSVLADAGYRVQEPRHDIDPSRDDYGLLAWRGPAGRARTDSVEGRCS
ncbi:hypothetical protein [Streptomyces sp. ODS05-4]|uniref:hypothetical protein n=1 Tax=Streptomyces sp. ODS05-4 TaxID=2944939 RepID=UPI00210AC2DA|nr:hypothetical protein [Streptomyces sp. ODS05-4]